MRNLHNTLFLSFFGVALASGCTITTSDGNGTGGSGGDETTATGGKTSTGGTTSSSTGGSTTAVFTAASCPASAATVPATVPDVTVGCINCIYTTACTQAVTCTNDGTCMSNTLKALECLSLFYQVNGSVTDADSVQACQDGSLTAADIPTAADITAAQMTVKSTAAGAWLGAVVPSNGTAVVSECLVECHLSDI